MYLSFLLERNYLLSLPLHLCLMNLMNHLPLYLRLLLEFLGFLGFLEFQLLLNYLNFLNFLMNHLLLCLQLLLESQLHLYLLYLL